MNEKSVGKDGQVEVEKPFENNDVGEGIEHVMECETDAKLEKQCENNYVNDIEAEGSEDEFNYEDFCGFDGINDFDNDLGNDFGHEVSEDDDTYRGDESSSSDTEESVFDDYGLTLYERSQIGDGEEELDSRDAMNGLYDLDGSSERSFFLRRDFPR